MFTKVAITLVLIFALSACTATSAASSAPRSRELPEGLYAVTGGTIRKSADAPLQDTAKYGKAFAACAGE